MVVNRTVILIFKFFVQTESVYRNLRVELLKMTYMMHYHINIY